LNGLSYQLTIADSSCLERLYWSLIERRNVFLKKLSLYKQCLLYW